MSAKIAVASASGGGHSHAAAPDGRMASLDRRRHAEISGSAAERDFDQRCSKAGKVSNVMVDPSGCALQIASDNSIISPKVRTPTRVAVHRGPWVHLTAPIQWRIRSARRRAVPASKRCAGHQKWPNNACFMTNVRTPCLTLSVVQNQ